MMPEVEMQRPEVEVQHPEVHAQHPEVQAQHPEVHFPHIEAKKPLPEAKKPLPEAEKRLPEVKKPPKVETTPSFGHPSVGGDEDKQRKEEEQGQRVQDRQDNVEQKKGTVIFRSFEVGNGTLSE